MATAKTSSSRFEQLIEQSRLEFSLPEGARRLIASGDFAGRQTDSLVRWLASDPALARRLLRWCNTPLYNLDDPFASLAEAVQVMQHGDLSRLALLAWVRGLFLPDLQIDIYRRETLWGHSIAVGTIAALISRTCNCADPSLVFVAGTLHDIGLAAHERLAPSSFTQLISEIDALTPTPQAEQDLLGWDHSQLGEAILKQWRLPDEIQLAARHHHDPEQSFSSPHADLVCCVSVANFLCSRSGWSSLGTHNLQSPPQQVFSRIGIDAELLTVLWQQLYPALDKVVELR